MMAKNRKLRKVLTVSLVATFGMGLLTGCNGGKAPASKEEKVLRIGVLSGGYDDSYFRQQYTDIYEFTHQNIKIEIVPAIDQSQYRYNDGSEEYVQPDYIESMKKIMTGSNPVDIVVSDTSTLKQLIQENLLKQLDPLMQEDKFETTDFVPAVIDGIKDLGDNQIYALSPSFSSSALFYNKKMFTDANIDLPTDKMTWDEVFNLARRLAKGEGKDRVYGFSFNRYRGSDPYWDMQTYVSALQMKTFDDKAETMTVNTPQWMKIWETMSKLSKDKIIPDNSSMEMNGSENWNAISSDLFLSGKVAMTIGESYYVNEIADANDNASKIKNYTPIDWDVVTIPVHPEKPDIGGNIWLNNTFAINSSAPNAETAWDFLKFINGEDWAKLKSRGSYEMVARKSFIQPKQGQTYNIQAFYLLKPLPPTNPKDDKMMSEKPGLYSITNSGRSSFQEVIDNKKTPEEALKDWETKGNKMLQEIKNNPKTQFQEDGTPFVPEVNGAAKAG